MRGIWIILLLIAQSGCIAQTTFAIQEMPVFKTSADSARYAQVNLDLRLVLSDRDNVKNIDSLMSQLRWLTENRVIGQRKIYLGSPGFITSDSLRTMSDFSGVHHVTVSEMKRMPKEVWHCKNLQTLELLNTKIRKLGKLNKLPKLTAIHVLNNTPRGKLRFSKNVTAKQLFIRADESGHLPVNYKNLFHLEKLDLTSCALTRFPTGLAANKHLKEIILNSNSIQLSNSKIELLSTVEKLALQRNKLESVPEQIKNLPNLKQLTLNHNSIRHVDLALGDLTYLEQVSFYRNKLTQIPEGVFKLDKLKEIDLYYNEIERVDEQLGNLKNLEILYLSNNKLIHIPESIGKLFNMKELYLSNNRLVEVPASLVNLQQLKVLRINNNRLTHFSFSLIDLPNLENLDISSNQFTELPEGISTLRNLKLIVLVENPWDTTTRALLPEMINNLKKRQVLVHAGE